MASEERPAVRPVTAQPPLSAGPADPEEPEEPELPDDACPEEPEVPEMPEEPASGPDGTAPFLSTMSMH